MFVWNPRSLNLIRSYLTFTITTADSHSFSHGPLSLLGHSPEKFLRYVSFSHHLFSFYCFGCFTFLCSRFITQWLLREAQSVPYAVIADYILARFCVTRLWGLLYMVLQTRAEFGVVRTMVRGFLWSRSWHKGFPADTGRVKQRCIRSSKLC